MDHVAHRNYMAKSSEINDIVTVCKIDFTTFNVGNSGATHPSSKCHQVTANQCPKEPSSKLNSYVESSDEPPDVPTKINNCPEGRNDDRIAIKTEIRMRGNSKQYMLKLRTLEDNWKFKEQFQRRFLPTNVSCPKGGHSKSDMDRYCNFLDFPSTAADRKLTGIFKPKRIEEIIRDNEIESTSNGNINGEEGINEEKSSQDIIITTKIGKCSSKSAKTKYVKCTLKKVSPGKLPKNILKKGGIHKRDDNSVDEDVGFEYMPYFITILEKDGSIRYLEDEGISSESDQSEVDKYHQMGKIKTKRPAAAKKFLVTTGRTKKSAATGETMTLRK